MREVIPIFLPSKDFLLYRCSLLVIRAYIESSRIILYYIYIKPLVKHKQYDQIEEHINRIDYARFLGRRAVESLEISSTNEYGERW